MAINYTWDVKTVDTKTIDGNADTVFNVHWRLTATDDVNNESATVYGTQILDTSDLSDFTAFADLTVSDVQGWVETAIGSDKITEIKSSLDTKIDELINPVVQTKTIE
ncbi:MAG: hypothetical protein Tp1100SUR763771_28 [Prokaryotic dsDNA virus sp.]|jgi:hypothetical protein|nr:MAG: hypothetical protein Tp1100SUR763771_28 [Prokaryotic dsDNA virus sp.]|tara:strand:+ start:677 stop:1000 length:324 start_codon:yes stop_codon:yes gene_type:complete